MILAIALALLPSGWHQSVRPTLRKVERDETAAVVTFVGRVLTPEGQPAPGAVVTTSAGGQAVTAADGSFQLATEVALAAGTVELTATLARGKVPGGMSASTSIVPGSLAPATRVGTLVLGTRDERLPRWQAGFGALPGVEASQSSLVDDLSNGKVTAYAVFDDGTGQALYVGGYFNNAGGVTANHVARWDGSRWTALGSGMAGTVPTVVFALAVFDDGNGAALYAGGVFSTAGGVPASNVARWNGAGWSALGSGLNSTVHALTVFDDGSGPALYAGGEFWGSGGPGNEDTLRVARWNGSSWSALGSGIEIDGGGGGGPAVVNALAVFDGGSGAALHVGGYFSDAGGVAAQNVARWDGSSWSALGSGTNLRVRTLATFDAGSGTALYAGGNFSTAGGLPASCIATWDGSSWSALGSGVFVCCSPSVRALTAFDDGNGPALYVGGSFTTAGGSSAANIARWDGSGWSPLGTGVDEGPNFPFVSALAVFDDGTGPALHVGGDFEVAGGMGVKRIAQWDGAGWSRLGRGLNTWVLALEVFDDGSGPGLYAGGEFASAGGTAGADRIARWDGSSWAPLGAGVAGGFPPTVGALEVFDDGSGPALYVAGDFTTAGGAPVNCVARWDGASWTALGSGIDATSFAPVVKTFAVFDDGSGAGLYVGGNFTLAGGSPANRIARWDGASWAPLGSGVNSAIEALVAYDDGTGPALYAGGSFAMAGGVAVNRVARWDGSSWSALAGGLGGGGALAFAVFDDGNGPLLFVSGSFTTAGGVGAMNLARWDGTSWSAVGSGLGGTSQPAVTALAVFDDGSGAALYATGNFVTMGEMAANRIARWNGTRWKALPVGLNDWGRAFVVHDDGNGPALYLGGGFDLGPEGDSYLAKWVRGIRTVSR